MAASFALPVIPGGTGVPPVSVLRPSEAPKFGRERAGAVRAGFHRLVMDDLRSAYLSDERPWVVGFSGGKDSTCLMQLVYYMLARIPAGQRFKPVYVLASDTRVEAPSISRRIRKELTLLSAAAERDDLPLTAHLVFPKLNDTFWVNLVGQGYAPRGLHAGAAGRLNRLARRLRGLDR